MRFKGKVAFIVANTEPEDMKRAVAAYRWHWMKSFRLWRWNELSRLLLSLTIYDAITTGLKQKKMQAHEPSKSS